MTQDLKPKDISKILKWSIRERKTLALRLGKFVVTHKGKELVRTKVLSKALKFYNGAGNAKTKGTADTETKPETAANQ